MSNNSNHYSIPITAFQSIFDPKSLRNFIKLGGLDKIVLNLNTNLNSGLPIDNNLNDYNNRILIYGKNKLPIKIQKNFLQFCKDAFNDKVLIILSISAIISLILGLYQTFYQPPDFDDNGNPLPKIQWIDGFAILLAVLIVVLVGALNDYNKEKQFIKLNNKKDDRKIIVFRSNEKLFISIYDLLVGDLLYIETGDILPADCILISGNCTCDESSITGESKTIKKSNIFDSLNYFNDEIKSISSSTNLSSTSTTSSYQFDIGDNDNFLDPFLISGSKLLSGQGKALVLCVGENSINGKIMMSLSNDNNNTSITPLQERLNILADGISKYGFMISILLFIILLIKLIIQFQTILKDLPLNKKLSKFINIIITSITVIVVAIPEGLPLAVTLALAFATIKMTEDGNLVRVLKSCETMGVATTICSDKTGTLTINKMSVVKGLFDLNHIFNISSNDNSNSFNTISNNLISLIIDNIVLNSTAFENSEKNNNLNQIEQTKHSWFNFFSSKKNNNPIPIKLDSFVGSKTECALLDFIKNELPLFNQKIRNVTDYRLQNELNIVKIIPFESDLKWSGIIYNDPKSNKFIFFIKGASEIIFKHCSKFSNLNGSINSLTIDDKNSIDKIRESFAKDALRVISLAHYIFEDNEISKINWENLNPLDLLNYPLIIDLTVGLKDPLRPNVKNAINQCHRAGVDVKMVTGDNILTARAISRDCGILNEENFNNNDYFMEGPKFRQLSEIQRFQILPKLHILARSSPTDKRILVETLKKMGEVVAVTGDGTNDAPALKLADVGFSMGLSGTEVAREASDIVLMSDDFSSIVNAIKWGRTVSASIKKFVQFQLTVNFTAVILTFLTSILSDESSSVLTAVQLLWVNLIMDTLAALALATDKPDDDILDSKPQGRNTSMISFNMWKMILGMSTFQLLITLIFNFFGPHLFFNTSFKNLTINEKMMLKTMVFNTFVWMQIFTMFVSRILNEPDNFTIDTPLIERLSYKNVGFFSHLGRNGWFIGITSLISILQIIIMIYGGVVFSVVPISTKLWAISLISSYMMIPFGTLLRIIPDSTIAKYLPLDKIKKIIKFIEWFMFGCGMILNDNNDRIYRLLRNDDDDDSDRDIEANFNDNSENRNFDNFLNNDSDDWHSDSATMTNTNTLNKSKVPEIILESTPSPILDAMHDGENHKLNTLTAVLH